MYTVVTETDIGVYSGNRERQTQVYKVVAKKTDIGV